jgi:hypothetical protein
MYFIDPNSLVQAAQAGQPRTPKANRRHFRALRSRPASASSVAVTKPHRHARVWTLVATHHAYN